MNKHTICECRHLTKSYGRNRVLKDCNITVRSGELAGLVGENGSGKTTLIRCLLGYAPPDSGSITLKGSIGYCPQEEVMNRVFTVREHLGLIWNIYAQHCNLNEDFLNHLIEVFRLKDYLDQIIGKLSGGTRQKIQFLGSILHQPSLLLLDEPYGGFDWEMYLAFWNIVDDLRNGGTGILIITHFLYDQQRFDQIYHLKNGMLYEDH